MAPWPELLAKQKENYRVEAMESRRVARTRISPHIEERLPRMRALRDELLRTIPGSVAMTRKRLRVRFPVHFVIYVGLGCGAGWATRYGDGPACLFGLENAAQVHLPEVRSYARVVPHVLAHLAHMEWRRKYGTEWPSHDSPWWQLYEEGFATQYEREIIGPASFRRRMSDTDWLPWRQKNQRWLARKFLAGVAAHRSVRPFFGSWYNIRGKIEMGY